MVFENAHQFKLRQGMDNRCELSSEGTVSDELVKAAFGRRALENGAGLYIVAKAGDQIRFDGQG